jgi:predicted deacylase
MAKKDAEGLWKFLTGRGIVEDRTVEPTAYKGPAFPLDNIEMIRTPKAGTVLFHRNIGETVAKGDLLATIITTPGMPDGTIEIRAPQPGFIVTRTSERLVRRNADLMKIGCESPSSATRKPGTLED